MKFKFTLTGTNATPLRYLAVGLGDDMDTSDSFGCYMPDANSFGTCSDYVTSTGSAATDEASNDISLVACGLDEGNELWFEVKKKLDTGDSDDKTWVGDETTSVVWAHGTVDGTTL